MENDEQLFMLSRIPFQSKYSKLPDELELIKSDYLYGNYRNLWLEKDLVEQIKYKTNNFESRLFPIVYELIDA